MCLRPMTTSANACKRKCAPNDNILFFAFSHREARFFAKLQPTSAPNYPRPRRLQFHAGVPSLLPRRTTKKKKKTWLGLKGDQCEQTFYNGGWSQATFIRRTFLQRKATSFSIS